jgi:hypothetical protein
MVCRTCPRSVTTVQVQRLGNATEVTGMSRSFADAVGEHDAEEFEIRI